jgi:hypothetical protein
MSEDELLYKKVDWGFGPVDPNDVTVWLLSASDDIRAEVLRRAYPEVFEGRVGIPNPPQVRCLYCGASHAWAIAASEGLSCKLCRLGGGPVKERIAREHKG